MDKRMVTTVEIYDLLNATKIGHMEIPWIMPDHDKMKHIEVRATSEPLHPEPEVTITPSQLSSAWEVVCSNGEMFSFEDLKKELFGDRE